MFVTFITLTFSILIHEHEKKSFLSWMRETNQFFIGEEYHQRFSIWITNLRLIHEHNKASFSWKSQINHLSALTPAEYQSLLGSKMRFINEKHFQEIKGDAPDEKDWRKDGYVTSIKSQGNCGSGWAFSVIGSQETQWAIKNQNLISLSAQNLIDCADVCFGCNGGDSELAFSYIIDSQDGFFASETDYPYMGVQEKCKFNKDKGICPVRSYYRPTVTKNEEQLRVACGINGAVAVTIDASQWSFQTYSHGIYDPIVCFNQRGNHEVTLVGYGIDNKIPFWILKNSWGIHWGEQGYMKLVRNKDNKCGIADDCLIPKLI